MCQKPYKRTVHSIFLRMLWEILSLFLYVKTFYLITFYVSKIIFILCPSTSQYLFLFFSMTKFEKDSPCKYHISWKSKTKGTQKFLKNQRIPPVPSSICPQALTLFFSMYLQVRRLSLLVILIFDPRIAGSSQFRGSTASNKECFKNTPYHSCTPTKLT